MYKKSIKENSKFLIPFLEGIKYYGSKTIEHALGTMIILNDKGDILTCKHIAQEFIRSDKLSNMYPTLLNEISKCKNKEELKEFEKEHNLKKDTIVLTNISLPFKMDENFKLNIKFHKYLDIALLRFEGVNTKLDNYPVFSRNLIEQGQSICRLGYAFPEYDFYEYSKETNNIVLKENVVASFPLFPMDGIMTRGIIDENNNLSMFETSTPGIRGQSGGPVFSPEGLIYGIQSMTKQLDLNFDINMTIKRGIFKKKVNYTPFINLGVAINSIEIIKFLEENNIEFQSK